MTTPTPAAQPLYDIFSPAHKLFEHNTNLAAQGLPAVDVLPPPTQQQAEIAAGLRPSINGTNLHMAPAAPVAPAMPVPAMAAPNGITSTLVDRALSGQPASPAPAAAPEAHWSERGAALFGAPK